MDWVNERYVRVYVRDTTTWLRLGWDGQALLMQLLRKVDMAGVLEIGDLEPWEAAVLHVRAPEELARREIPRLLEACVLKHAGDCLVMPNFVEAQEACKSDRQRQRESRDRRKAKAEANGHRLSVDERSPDTTGHAVTERSQNVTNTGPPSQNVTESTGHVTDASRSVTARHSIPCSTVPCSTVREPRAHEDPSTESRQTSTVNGTPDTPLFARLADCWDGSEGMGLSSTVIAKLRGSVPRMRKLSGSQDGDELVRWFAAVVERFRADPRVQRRKLGLQILLEDLEAWSAPTHAEVADEEAARRERSRLQRLIAEHEQMCDELDDDDEGERSLRRSAEAELRKLRERLRGISKATPHDGAQAAGGGS